MNSIKKQKGIGILGWILIAFAVGLLGLLTYGSLSDFATSKCRHNCDITGLIGDQGCTDKYNNAVHSAIASGIQGEELANLIIELQKQLEACKQLNQMNSQDCRTGCGKFVF